MKKAWIWILVIVIVIVLGYLGRNKIRSLYSGVYTSPTSLNANPSKAPSVSGDIVTTKSGAKGSYLVSSNGMTLYIFDKDSKGVSNCSGSCAGIWPPYVTSTVLSKLPANVATITRSDGMIQFTYKGMPLYYYSGDVKIGDLNGDGVNGTWHLVKR